MIHLQFAFKFCAISGIGVLMLTHQISLGFLLFMASCWILNIKYWRAEHADQWVGFAIIYPTDLEVVNSLTLVLWLHHLRAIRNSRVVCLRVQWLQCELYGVQFDIPRVGTSLWCDVVHEEPWLQRSVIAWMVLYETTFYSCLWSHRCLLWYIQ
jgi:hypothetical protein